jgi:hypothetical protein
MPLVSMCNARKIPLIVFDSADKKISFLGKCFSFPNSQLLEIFALEQAKSENCSSTQVNCSKKRVIRNNLHRQVSKMLVPPHMIEEQSKIIYQINKYYVERVQTRMSIIDKTIREICQIVQDILRVSLTANLHFLFSFHNQFSGSGSGSTRATIHFQPIGMQWQVSCTIVWRSNFTQR